MRFHLTRISQNVKTGPIPTAMSSKDTCPDSCPLKGNGCYAQMGHSNIHWSRLSKGIVGVAIGEFCKAIAALPRGQLWRWAVAGDLPGENETIDADMLRQITAANRGRKGYGYTHKYNGEGNLALIKEANDAGFILNLSANSPAHADQLAKTGAGPVVCILPKGTAATSFTPEGRKIVMCPAQTREYTTCASCQLCQKQRSVIVGFEAHGIMSKRVSKVADTFATPAAVAA